MKDQEFLMWIHERLVKVHNEDELMDHMHRLRKIIITTPATRNSTSQKSYNSLGELKSAMKI